MAFLDAPSHFCMRLCPSVGLPVHGSVCFLNARKCVFSSFEIARGWEWRGERLGSDEGGGERHKKEGGD